MSRALVILLVLALSSCAMFEQTTRAHRAATAKCLHVTSNNAAITCGKALHTWNQALAESVQDRYEAGRLTAAERETFHKRLQLSYERIVQAEDLALLGNLGEAEGQFDALLAALETLEGEVP